MFVASFQTTPLASYVVAGVGLLVVLVAGPAEFILSISCSFREGVCLTSKPHIGHHC